MTTRRTDIAALRDDFPLLAQMQPAQPLTYLDSAATTQKPTAVLDAIRNYYLHDNANVHRAAHALADRATTAFEGARAQGTGVRRRGAPARNRLDARHDGVDQSRRAELRRQHVARPATKS